MRCGGEQRHKLQLLHREQRLESSKDLRQADVSLIVLSIYGICLNISTNTFVLQIRKI